MSRISILGTPTDFDFFLKLLIFFLSWQYVENSKMSTEDFDYNQTNNYWWRGNGNLGVKPVFHCLKYARIRVFSDTYSPV